MNQTIPQIFAGSADDNSPGKIPAVFVENTVMSCYCAVDCFHVGFLADSETVHEREVHQEERDVDQVHVHGGCLR